MSELRGNAKSPVTYVVSYWVMRYGYYKVYIYIYIYNLYIYIEIFRNSGRVARSIGTWAPSGSLGRPSTLNPKSLNHPTAKT